METMYSPDGMAQKKIREWLADGQPKDTCVRALTELTGASARTIQHVLGLMQSVNEIELSGSYLGMDCEDHFQIQAIPQRDGRNRHI